MPPPCSLQSVGRLLPPGLILQSTSLRCVRKAPLADVPLVLAAIAAGKIAVESELAMSPRRLVSMSCASSHEVVAPWAQARGEGGTCDRADSAHRASVAARHCASGRRHGHPHAPCVGMLCSVAALMRDAGVETMSPCRPYPPTCHQARARPIDFLLCAWGLRTNFTTFSRAGIDAAFTCSLPCCVSDDYV